MEKVWFARFQNRARKPYQLIWQNDYPEHVIPLTDDGFCVFLSHDKRCVIYKDRPLLCRLYGTIPQLQCTRLCGLQDDLLAEVMDARGRTLRKMQEMGIGKPIDNCKVAAS